MPSTQPSDPLAAERENERREERGPKPVEGASLDILKQRAHGRIRSQLKCGAMVRPEVCSHCGTSPGLGKDGRSLLQAHHHKGYDLPLEVEWLCARCHRAETPVNPLRGEAAIGAKLTNDTVKSILASSENNTQLAKRHGVSRKLISYIRRGTSWPHIPREVAHHDQ